MPAAAAPEETVGDRLTTALGRSPDEGEVEAWKSMSPKQRERALVRMDALRRWVRDERHGTAVEEAERLGVTPKRFYNMVSGWRRTPGLSSLGTFSRISMPRSRLDAKAVNALQSLLPRVIDGARGEKRTIESLRSELEGLAQQALVTAGVPVRLPSRNIVRAMITRELDRRDQARMLGREIRMDCVATSMVQADGAPHVVFLVMERAAGLVLGFSIGGEPGGLAGYAAAARDAVVRGIPAIQDGSWADAVDRIDLVPHDPDFIRDHLIPFYALPVRPELGFTRKDDFGRYVRPIIGERMGRTYLRPSRVGGASVVGDDSAGIFSLPDAQERFRLESADYNAERLRTSDLARGGPAPEMLLLALNGFVESGAALADGRP